MAKGGKGNGGNVIIKKEEVVEGGHHGGAWKVAYADFVTAMMAFFLLMWLLNATTDAQRKGLADYFSPSNVLGRNLSGSGAPFGGHTPFDEGAMVSDRGAVQAIEGKIPVPADPDEDEAADTPAQDRTYQQQPAEQPNPDTDARGNSLKPSAQGKQAAGPTDASAAAAAAGPQQGAGAQQQQRQTAAQAEAAREAAQAAAHAAAQERREFASAAEQIKAAVRADPALAELAHQLAIDQTPEGLRIQMLDEEHQSMFTSGSATPNERARLLLQKVVPVLNKLSEDISVGGYTDSAPYPGGDRTNWELSAERANATRRLLTDAGLADGRIRSVTGHADRDPLLPQQPMAAANRRIAIVVLRRAAAPAAR
jgi:chemotaxis protein MotB